MRHAILALSILIAVEVAAAGEPAPPTLTFDDRVNAQEAIERVYHSHQLGATKPFHEAVPRSVLEAKAHKYLDETATLNVYRKTDVTDEMLKRELERMASGTGTTASSPPSRLRGSSTRRSGPEARWSFGAAAVAASTVAPSTRADGTTRRPILGRRLRWPEFHRLASITPPSGPVAG